MSAGLEILREKREEIIRIAAKHGALNVRVFGSVVRREAQDRSDIDLLIDAAPMTSPWFPAGLVLELEALLGRSVDVVTEKTLHWYIRDSILKEAIPL